jgi:predicted acylesterase/phospholipase RssA
MGSRDFGAGAAQARREVLGAAFVALLVLLAGCASSARLEAPPVAPSLAVPVGFPGDVRFLSANRRALEFRSSDLLTRLRGSSPDGSLNILALSGGGAGGAFGAGAIVGLGRRADRPHFEIVAGVSTGAMIAPFAYLGPDWDDRLAAVFHSIRGEDLLRVSGLGTLFGAGIYRGEPLMALADRIVTPELVAAVAARAATGPLLLVASTDLDTEETIIWDLGRIAAVGGPAARRLFRDVLVASASIPGLFPPVLIPVESGGRRYQEMHVDGGATVPFFVAPEQAFLLPLDVEGLRGARLYVIVNGQLSSAPLNTRVSTVPVMTRAFSATLSHMARTEVALTATFAERYEMAFSLTEVPVDYPFGGSLDFDPDRMAALFRYAADCAEHGWLWTSVAEANARAEQGIARARPGDSPADIDCPRAPARPTQAP